ncbi:transcriptional regulator [Streptomyces uncialis]|uniref:transcriptional regulator n=1 Tax=Streptomyces uncialis TaxID=1048205 RepID=UPI00386DDD2C|nr:transcriptional regulator [Streptomyces uncialis]
MTKDYGRPGRADDNRGTVARRLDEAAAKSGPQERLTIEWRGQPTHLDVIQLPVGDLYYNPGTHRVRAQRSYDPVREAQLEEDPWSPAGQEYLGTLLKALPSAPSRVDPEFTALKESLQEYGQSDPGLVTWDGVLVNGNTRRAALMDLSGPTTEMRVAVLPESCDWGDIAKVELSLQLRKEHRRDYSYINRLLAVQELVKQGTPLPVIAATFRTTVARCEQDQWVYSCVEAMIERSAKAGVRLPLVAFENDAEKLRELQRAYAKAYAANPENADLLLESRMSAIMLGFSKTDVRHIEPDFRVRYLESTLPEGLLPAPAKQEGVAIPGLGRSVRGPSPKLAAAKALTDTVLQARAVAEASASQVVPSEEVAKFAGQLDDIKKAMDGAIDRAGRDNRVRKRKQAAPARLADACQSIEQCVTDLVMSRASRSLDEEGFDDAVVVLRKALTKLARESGRTVKNPGDGVAWLIAAMEKDD